KVMCGGCEMMLGMAGLAEAGLAAAMGAWFLGVLLTGLAAILGLALRSRIAALASAALSGLIAFLFQPWDAFWSEPSTDPDVLSFQATALKLTWWWLYASAASIASLAWSFRRASPHAETQLPRASRRRLTGFFIP